MQLFPTGNIILLLQVEEVDQTSGHHTDHCSTPATKELLSRPELEGPATKPEGSYLAIHTCTVY